MKQIWTVFLLLLCSFSVAMAEDHAATVKQVRGDVRVERSGNLVTPVAGEFLFAGDVVKTGKDGAVGFIFVDGSRISMGPSSDMVLEKYAFEPKANKYAFDVFMKKGSAVYSSGRLGKLDPDAVSFRTPKATVGIRGTKFLVKVE